MSRPVTAKYRPRRIRCMEIWQPEGWTLKVYAVEHDGRHLDAPMLARAKARALTRLAEVDATDPAHHSMGLVTLHLGENGDYLLVNTWTDNDILRHANFGAAPGGEFRDDWPGTAACVWELAVIQHEREAWLRHMLRPDGPADPDAWMADLLNATI